MISNYILLLFSASLLACASENQEEKSEVPFKHHETIHQDSHHLDSTTNPFKGATFKTEAVKNDSLGWGYTIYINGKKAVTQPHVPGVQGKKGFNTKAQALKTADFVVYKIQHNILPPSVTKEDLDSLGVLK
ncbi:MAG: hypothetical protein JWO58_2096 [Chitinophagaceae bacterium]|nr:hypothetical protein [Chitinophagaceae bacterium]